MNQKPWLDSYPPHVKWNQKFKGKPLHNLIDDTAAIIPQNVALDFMGKTWTYGDVEKAAHWLFQAALQGYQPAVEKYRVICQLEESCDINDFYC